MPVSGVRDRGRRLPPFRVWRSPLSASCGDRASYRPKSTHQDMHEPPRWGTSLLLELTPRGLRLARRYAGCGVDWTFRRATRLRFWFITSGRAGWPPDSMPCPHSRSCICPHAPDAPRWALSSNAQRDQVFRTLTRHAINPTGWFALTRANQPAVGTPRYSPYIPKPQGARAERELRWGGRGLPGANSRRAVHHDRFP